MMASIVTNQRDTLLNLSGTATWSGQAIQQYNSQAIAWGGFSTKLFSVGGQYQWVTLALLVGFLLPLPFWIGHRFFPKLGLDYFNTALISSYIGLLNVGVNAVTMPWFIIGAWSQLYMRKYHSDWFIKYNYILSAAMDGGTQVMVFILSFAVFGTGGAIASITCTSRFSYTDLVAASVPPILGQ
jgi:OPT oligopeptide transporter protein